MENAIENLVRSWGDEELSEINLRLHHLEKRLFYSYEPSLPPQPDFFTRLEKWLGNIDPSDQESKKNLLRLASQIFYIGYYEFLELYRYAYTGPITRWIIDLVDINICDPNASHSLQDAICQTWFCPITDSMRINSFYNSNNIPTKANYRPDWRSLAKFGDAKKITAFCEQNNFKRIVLLEDFVGGGSQVKEALEYAATLANKLEILIVPLIICPVGDKKVSGLENKYQPNIRYEPIVSIPSNTFISLDPADGEPEIYATIREFSIANYPIISGQKRINPEVAPYHPLGFPTSKPTGGLIVMHTNTPNNTLPLIHWTSKTWNPLFPRNNRV